MPSQITVTSSIGPGQTITTKVFSDLKVLHLDIARGIMTIESINKQPVEVSLSGITTLTDSISSGLHTIVAS